MVDLLKFLVYAALLLTPCIVATRCASERKWKRQRNAPPYTGIERRDYR
jgi:hypothetical protein